MAGGGDTYNTVTLNIATKLLEKARERGCRPYSSDMKVRIEENLFYYPDVMFICEDDPNESYKEKPCVTVALSSSTNHTDKNEKRHAYLAMPSLKLYLIVDSRRQYVLGHYRTKTGWEEQPFSEGDTVPIPCANTELTFADIYIQTPYL